MKKVVLKKFTTKRSYPINLEEIDMSIFSQEFIKKFQKSYYFYSKNVSLNNLNLSKFKNLYTYSKYTKMIEYTKIKKIKFFVKNFNLKESDKKIYHIAKASWIIDEKSFHYFHWICDALPRLILISSLDNEYPILIPKSFTKFSYILNTLNLININYLIYEDDTDYIVDRLIITSHVANSGNYNKENIKKLSNKLLQSSSKNTKSKKLWISRKYSKHRKIQNEEELFILLKKYDYLVIFPEKLDYKTQINLFKNAKVISGLHGGGLTNAIFMKKNSVLFEIRRENDNKNNCYFTLASELDLKYFYLNAQKLGEDLYIDDVYLDINKLESVLKKIENELDEPNK